MRIGITRQRLVELIKGKARLGIEKGKYCRIHGITNDGEKYITTCKIGENGKLKIIEKVNFYDLLMCEKFILITSKSVAITF